MHEELELYALHALEAGETEQIEAHLEDCEECRIELASYYETLALLSTEEVRPSARLKMQVLSIPSRQEQVANIVPLQRGRKTVRWTLTAIVSIAASFVLGITLAPNFFTEDPIAPTAPPTATPVSLLEEVQEAEDAATVMRRMNGASMRIDYSREMDAAVFSSRSLAPLVGTQVYQLWVQDSQGSMRPAGDFTTATALIRVESSLDDVVALGITRESNPGHRVPTSSPLALIRL